MGRFQLIGGPERRRRWSEEQKRAPMAAAIASGATVAEVARRADLCARQIYRWRQERRSAGAGFAAVLVTTDAIYRSNVPRTEQATEIELGWTPVPPHG